MLGDVARWLRILGEDCLYADPGWSDDRVLEEAMREDRIIVTRDAGLVQRAGKKGLRTVHVDQDKVVRVLVTVYACSGVDPDPSLVATRCSHCNGSLVRTDAADAAARADAGGRVPPRPEVLERHQVFWSCTRCGQPYWRGTHWKSIDRLRRDVAAAVRMEADWE